MDYSGQPLISIVIPTSGTSPALQSCLHACDQVREKIHCEVILVFDQAASAESLNQVLKEFPHFKILFSQVAGTTSARNLGLGSITGRHFLLIDDDCIMGNHEWIEDLVSRCSSATAIHGGYYRLTKNSTYWAQVYNWVNSCWLHFGKNPKGHQEHLLGGFIFGSSLLNDKISFNPSLKWGGEEKEMLTRLRNDFQIAAQLHEDLAIEHFDTSGFGKFVRRAFLQGLAAGSNDLHTLGRGKPIALSAKLIPGLSIFYFFSRLGIFSGKFMKIKNGKVKIAETSPAA